MNEVYQEFGLNEDYSLKIVINTDVRDVLSMNDDNGDNKERQEILNDIKVYRYLIETKLVNMLNNYKNTMNNADLKIIKTKSKRDILIKEKHKMGIHLKYFDDKIISLIDMCNNMQISQSKKNENTNNNNNSNTQLKNKPIKQYVNVGMPILNSNQEKYFRQKKVANRLKDTKRMEVNQQRTRILFKKLNKKKSRKTQNKGFGWKLQDSIL